MIRLGTILLFSFAAHAEITVKLEKNGIVEKINSHERTEVDAKKPFTWEGKEPIAIFQDEMLPVIAVPIDYQGDINVKAIAVKEVLKAKIDELVDRSLSDVLTGITEIQKLSRKRHFKLAQDRYRALRIKYPGVKFLDFIGASLSLLLGDKNGARVLATQGLQTHPDYSDGRTFLKNLEEAAE
jgi:hypothetical protein